MPPGKGRHSGSGCHMAHILTDRVLQIRDLNDERLRVGYRGEEHAAARIGNRQPRLDNSETS